MTTAGESVASLVNAVVWRAVVPRCMDLMVPDAPELRSTDLFGHDQKRDGDVSLDIKR
tara:strand:+ start:1139 stop:1312 length:174 start_codon:yes stop_codon:yes gene_type:complete